MGTDLITNNEHNDDGVSVLLGDPKNAILKLSIPTIVAMVINSFYGFVDGVWVAGLGGDALAAIGFVGPLYTIVFGISSGIGSGATAVISKYIGANNKKEADNASVHILLLTVIMTILFTVLILVFLKPFLIAMGAGPTINLAMDYGNILFLGSIFIIFSSTSYGIFRGEGNVKRATYSMLFGSILNIFLDPIFIYYLNFGVSGAAIATTISMAVVCILLIYWFKTDSYIEFNFKDFIYKNKIIKEILNVGLPAGSEFLFASILTIFLNIILMTVSGVDGVAVYTGGWRFVTMMMVIVSAIGISAIAVTGANFGAKRYKNIDIALDYGIKFATIIMVLISIAIFIFAQDISYLFAYTPGSENLLGQMTDFLRITCLFYLFLPLGVISSSVFQGLEKGLNSLIVAFTRALLLQIIFAYIFAFSLDLGQIGVWFGIVLGNAIGGIIGYVWSKFDIFQLIKNSLR